MGKVSDKGEEKQRGKKVPLLTLPCPSLLATKLFAITSLLITKLCLFYIAQKLVKRGTERGREGQKYTSLSLSIPHSGQYKISVI